MDSIRNLKRCINIPVIGNGNIKSEEDALKMLEYTGTDGIMIARGAIGNPFIFQRIIQYLKNGKVNNVITKSELLDTMIKHINLEVNEKGEYTGIREMRKHLSYYTKGLQNGSYIRGLINTIEDKEILINTLREFLSN